MPILAATMSTGINTIARRTRGGFTSSATASGTGSTSAAAISAAQANARAAISFQSAINNRAAIGTLYLSNGTLSTGTSTLIGNAYSDEGRSGESYSYTTTNIESLGNGWRVTVRCTCTYSLSSARTSYERCGSFAVTPDLIKSGTLTISHSNVSSWQVYITAVSAPQFLNSISGAVFQTATLDGTSTSIPLSASLIQAIKSTGVCILNVGRYRDGDVSNYNGTATISGMSLNYELAYVTLTYNANGGTNAPAAETVYASASGYTTTITASVPTKDRYAFRGWATTPTGTAAYQAGDSISLTENTTLYAVWELNTYTVTYAPGANGTGTPQSASQIIGTPITLLGVTFTRLGWTQVGWATTDGGNKDYDLNAVYSANQSITLYPYWGGEIPVEFRSDLLAYQEVPIGTAATPLDGTVKPNGLINHYLWGRSPNGADNWAWLTTLPEDQAIYTPDTTQDGSLYYKVKVTAIRAGHTREITSNVAQVKVVKAQAPTFTSYYYMQDATYNAGDLATPLNASATAPYGTISYQWYKSYKGSQFTPITGETGSIFTPNTRVGGVTQYKAAVTNTVGTSSATVWTGTASITIENVVLALDTQWTQYLQALKGQYKKLARLDFLNPNGSVAFSLDYNELNSRSGAFIQEGSLSVNLQNGARRTATVTLANLDGEYDYNVNKLWFGQQVQLWMGIVLPGGEPFYLSQGVFYIKDPEEVFKPGLKQTTLNLVDKWAYLDGTLFGNLDGTYEIPLNSNIFNAINSILQFDRGNGQKVDATIPVFTGYYNGKTTTLPDGTTVPLTNTPYTYRCDSDNGSYADVILELNTMLAGWIGYDAFGQLRLSPSQDDIVDQNKPIQWEFTPLNSTFLGATYVVKNSEVYNDIIIMGESLSEYGQTAGRATNYDPASDTNANLIGKKTKRYQQSGYYTQDICESLAVFKLKRQSILKKSVTIESTQMFHLVENNLVTIQRTDKPGNPVERHLVTGYTIPIGQTGSMTINATSVQDFPVATITTAQ